MTKKEFEMNRTLSGPLIAKGRTAEVYAWQDNQVLKLFYDWCPPNWVQNEINIGQMMVTKALPTPKLIDTVNIESRQGIIYERVKGPTMLELCSTKPWLLFRLARQLAELHTQIHTQDGAGLSSLRSSLYATIQQVNVLPAELKSGVLHLLDKLPDGNALCHFDFHPGQVIVTARGPVILDWMTAYQGYPQADTARTSIILTLSQVPGAGLATRVITNLWRGLFHRTYIARYLELHPDVTRDEITTWMIPVAAGRIKEGIPAEQEALIGFIRAHLHMP
jgi:hypothetical protein